MSDKKNIPHLKSDNSFQILKRAIMRVMAPTGFSPIKVEFNDNPAIYLYKSPFGSLCILQDSKPLLSIRSEKIDVFLKDLLARVGGNIRQKTQPSSMLVLNMD